MGPNQEREIFTLLIIKMTIHVHVILRCMNCKWKLGAFVDLINSCLRFYIMTAQYKFQEYGCLSPVE